MAPKQLKLGAWVMRKCHVMLCITANDQTDSNKFDFEHKDLDSNFAKPETKVVKNFIDQ